MTDKLKKLEQLQGYVDVAADLVIEATDEEIEEDIRERGEDPKQSADHVRKLFQAAISARNKKRLEKAKIELANQRRDRTRKEQSMRLPDTDRARRELLAAILTRSDLPSELTMAFRSREEDLDDDEVTSILQDFEELGLIDKDQNGGD